MKIAKRIGILLAVLGLLLYVPPVMHSLVTYFGEPVGRLAGVVSFSAGWAILGACVAFSAGLNLQFARIRKRGR